MPSSDVAGHSKDVNALLTVSNAHFREILDATLQRIPWQSPRRMPLHRSWFSDDLSGWMPVQFNDRSQNNYL
jgi:hypothetical protein